MSTPAQPSNSMPQSHARGFAGEQSMGFFLGEKGYFFVEGPSGAGGHGITQSGFDGVAYNPETNHLIIYDNKSYGRAGNVYGACSIDPTKNLLQNFARLINHVQTIQDLPEQAKILNLLRLSRVAVQIGGALPPRVQIAVSNASGRSTGVGPTLAGRGIEFIDYYQAPNPSRQMFSNQDIMAAAGLALGKLFMWLGDVAIERDINRHLENMAGRIANILSHGEGVLIIVVLDEWDHDDGNGNRKRYLTDVYIQAGKTESSAKAEWQSVQHLVRSSPRALYSTTGKWVPVVEYRWMPPN